MSAPLRIDLICEVLDNFGDAGISWRLACQLADEWGAHVRLCIDQPELLTLWAARAQARSRPETPVPAVIDLSAADFYEVHHTPETRPELIITMLGSATPAALERLIRDESIPWLRYEYLTAETWIDSFHGLPSLKPDSGATEWFYYPGFSADCGGLLREPDLIERLDRFAAPDHAERQAWLCEHGLDSPPGHLRICLFGYPDQPTRQFLAALQAVESPVTVLMSASLAQALDLIDRPGGTDHLHIKPHAWLDQPDFDLLLASCDLNIVRGEDSWLRAQWAGQPMLWQPYRVADGTHFDKLAAFLDRLLADAPAPAGTAIAQMMAAINGQTDPGPALADWLAHRQQIQAWHRQWRFRLAAQTSLTQRLARFCTDKLQLPALSRRIPNLGVRPPMDQRG